MLPSQTIIPRAWSITIVGGAFLLFWIQPLAGRYVQPGFGGAPEVWTTCMLFFQAALLAGYAYAHGLIRRFRPVRQAWIHSAVLLAGAVALLALPTRSLQPPAGLPPVAGVLVMLLGHLALPFVILAATGPLLQGWLGHVAPRAKPYRLYALSNAASLLALLAYPFVLEPLLGRTGQSRLWSAAWLGYAMLTVSCAIRMRRASADHPRPWKSRRRVRVSLRRQAFWLALPTVASVLLLAVTGRLSQDLASVPLLWVLPLLLYLTTFILCFRGRRWYPRRLMLVAFVLALTGMGWMRWRGGEVHLAFQLLLPCAALWTGAMICHGELYRLRPAPGALTRYYLSLAAGGALGGVLTAVVAPLVFQRYLELPLSLLGCFLLALLTESRATLGRRRAFWVVVILLAGSAMVYLQGMPRAQGKRAILQERNFFGVLTLWVEDEANPETTKRILQHGTTMHGVQFTAPDRQDWPTAYYGPRSGGGLAMQHLFLDRPRHIGVVGLGVGTLSTYGREEDRFVFYEIDPDVERIAREYFTYLRDTPAGVDVLLGDARMTMQQQDAQGFDLLLLDAFSSDAVPVHLLTREAFELYLHHLRPGGVLGVHISTYHVDLHSVVWKAAQELGLHTAWIASDENPEKGIFSADWILLSRSPGPLETPSIERASSTLQPRRDIRLWTDDHVSLIEVLK